MVEILENGQWVEFANARAAHVEANRWLVTITGVPIWVRLNALDSAPLRIEGHEAFRVWGTRKAGTELVLDCLVQ